MFGKLLAAGWDPYRAGLRMFSCSEHRHPTPVFEAFSLLELKRCRPRRICTELHCFWNADCPQTRMNAHSEHSPVTPGVAGSSPVHSANKFNEIKGLASRGANPLLVLEKSRGKPRGKPRADYQRTPGPMEDAQHLGDKPLAAPCAAAGMPGVAGSVGCARPTRSTGPRRSARRCLRLPFDGDVWCTRPYMAYFAICPRPH